MAVEWRPPAIVDPSVRIDLGRLGTTLVTLTCSCGYRVTARGGEAAVDALRAHTAHAGCPASA